MKKVLIFLFVAGVLFMGTFAIAEELPESPDEKGDLLEGEDLGDPEYGDPNPCGGGSGAGPGGVPG
jgi:hypothetical protein